jgi:phage protein D
MATTRLSVPQVSQGFGDFYVPRFEISASGRALEASVVRDVLQVTYNDAITEIDSFDITVNNWDADAREFKYVGAETDVAGATPMQKLFNPGAAEFELKIGYGSDLVSLMKGTTQSLEPSFVAGSAPTLTMRALNVLHQLRTKQHRDHWPNDRVPRGQVKISRIAQDIGQRRNPDGCRFPLPIRIDNAALGREPVLDYLAQDNQYDIDFLLIEARKIGYVVYVDREVQAGGSGQDVLRFCPSDARHPGVADVCYELEWGISLIDFSPKLSIANQVSAVELRSRNRETNESILARVTTSDADLRQYNITANRDLISLIPGGGGAGRCQGREEVITNQPQFTQPEADRRAAAALSERLKQLVEASGTTVGLPNLRAGQRVRIIGLGKRFSGVYFVTKTTHTLNDSGYLTKFTARREAGLEGGGR